MSCSKILAACESQQLLSSCRAEMGCFSKLHGRVLVSGSLGWVLPAVINWVLLCSLLHTEHGELLHTRVQNVQSLNKTVARFNVAMVIFNCSLDEAAFTIFKRCCYFRCRYSSTNNLFDDLDIDIP